MDDLIRFIANLNWPVIVAFAGPLAGLAVARRWNKTDDRVRREQDRLDEQARWVRDDRVRAEQAKRDVYVAFLSATRNFIRFLGRAERPGPLSPVPGRYDVRALHRALDTIVLIAPDHVRDAAISVNDEVERLHQGRFGDTRQARGWIAFLRWLLLRWFGRRSRRQDRTELRRRMTRFMDLASADLRPGAQPLGHPDPDESGEAHVASSASPSSS